MTPALRRGVARTVFLMLVGGFAAWGLRDSGDEVARVVRGTDPGRLAAALALVLVGLLITGHVWRRVLVAHGHRIPVTESLCIFFVGQLGKYVPGSVWSLGVQARMARSHGVPVRSTVSTGLVFLLLHVATGLLAGSLAAGLAWNGSAAPASMIQWGMVACAVLGMLLLIPVVTRSLADRTVGRALGLNWGRRDAVVCGGLMALVWTFYTLALVLVVPGEGVEPMTLCAAFALGYVAGVAVPLAPAGLGAREGVFLAVLTPVMGLGPAAALAALARVMHTVADFIAAAGAWLIARRTVRNAA